MPRPQAAPDPARDARREAEKAAREEAIAAAEAGAPDTVEAILEMLPDLAAEVARKDIAARVMGGGERPDEQNQVLGLARALRTRLQAAEASAVHALMAIGCEATSAIDWLRSEEDGEPRYQRLDGERLIRIPVMGLDAFEASPLSLTARLGWCLQTPRAA